MNELKPRIHDESNGLDYVLVGDYYVPDLKLPEEHRSIGRWGRLHRAYLEQCCPARSLPSVCPADCIPILLT